MNLEWQLIETAPKDRDILLAGKYDGIGQSGRWDMQVGRFLANRFPFVGNKGPTHWAKLPNGPDGSPPADSYF